MMKQHASDRMILAIRASSLKAELAQSGFHASSHDAVCEALRDAEFWIGPRPALETLEAFRQIIPYIVLTDGKQVVCYERTPAGGEARLHGKLSIGLGGHIDFSDVVRHADTIDVDATMSLSAKRELVEELAVETDNRFNWLGLIVEDDTPVSRVHVGVVGVVYLDSTTVAGAEEAVDNVRLLSANELQAEHGRLEGWSQRLLPHLNAIFEAVSQVATRKSAAGAALARAKQVVGRIGQASGS